MENELHDAIGGGGLMIGAVALSFMLLHNSSLFIWLGVPLFFVCISAAWYFWFKKLSASTALLVGGILTTSIACILFAWEAIIRDTIAFNLILIAAGSIFVFMGVIALVGSLWRRHNIGSGLITAWSICACAYCVWLWGWRGIPFGYGP